ncbi:hypothetical protein AB0M58_13750 [Streptomyces bobili]|uniref:hypothetical protein n=1 Tax=Streptomyces bobili TaxID=67280 RepID=UPI003424CC0C
MRDSLYTLGHQYLSGGNYLAAEQWLRVAAGHSVPGAEQDLKGIEALLLCGPLGENPQ